MTGYIESKVIVEMTELLYERDILMCINLGEIEKLQHHYHSCINLSLLMHFDQK